MTSADFKEKGGLEAAITASTDQGVGEITDVYEKEQVFKHVSADGVVNFRKVSWFKACVLFTKVLFATGVLSIPTAMYSLGAVPGALEILAWAALNTYCFILLGDFRERHPSCHSVADMAYIVGGVINKEIIGALFILAYVLCAGSGIIGVATGLNALSHHRACTVWWSFLATAVIVAASSIRKLDHVGWLSYVVSQAIPRGVFTVMKERLRNH